MEAAEPKHQRPRPSCKAKAVDFLARSDQSIRRLTEKLQRKEYTDEEIQETIDWLQEKHFCGKRMAVSEGLSICIRILFIACGRLW